MVPAATGVPLLWRTARGAVPLDRPVVVGILNVTPDSFWYHGRHTDVDAATAHAARLLEEGADIIDVGGESTRPGASAVSADQEIGRVVPVIDAIARRWTGAIISVDTAKSAVARAALDAGAAIINDVAGLRLDPAIAQLAAAHNAGIIIMHSRGDVATMARYELARYGPDTVGDVIAELEIGVQRARHAGVPDDAIVLDPGLGFAKRTAHSLAILAGLQRIADRGFPVLVGPSRKRFIGEAAGGLPAEERGPGTVAACVMALERGARLFRVHDVADVRRALDFAATVSRAGEA
jgi:dihydropteroate synthase